MLDAKVIEGFVRTLLWKRFDNAVEIPQCHREWWELFTSNDTFVALAAPRGHAKSTAITHSYTLACVLFREAKFVVIVSDTEAQASLFLNDIKSELTDNDSLIEVFGVKRFIKFTETDIVVEMNDGYRFKIVAKGVDQFKRGLKWEGRRPDLIVCDDLENEEIVYNQDRREKFRKWFYGTLLPAKSDKGKIRIIGTILHLDSLLERLMPKGEYCKTIGLKEINTNPKSLWKSARYRAHNEDFTEILWKEKFSKERLLQIRKEYVDQGMPDVYSQEYLNYPLDLSRTYFRRVDFIAQTEEDKERPLRYYAAMDLAISQKDRADYTVIVVVGVDDRGIHHVVDVRRDRWDAFGIINEMFSVQQRYEPELFGMEKGMIERSLGPFLRAEMIKRGVYINVHYLPPTKDKQARARSLQARMRAGGVRFDKSADWYPALEQEMLRFPRDRHNDQVDALSWIGLMLDLFEEAPTKEELEEQEYEEMVNEFPSGRSAICGY